MICRRILPALAARFLATSTLALVALNATTQAQIGQVLLYEDSSYNGNVYPFLLLPGTENLPFNLGSFGDKTTSLRWSSLPTNVSVTCYEHSNGGGVQYNISRTAARTGSVSNIGATYNDTFSSISWQLDDPSVGGTVTLYELGGFGGINKRLPLSSYAEGQVHPIYGFNDKTSSIRWALESNVVVTFFEHPDGTGREYAIGHDAARSSSANPLPSNYDNRFSSWRWDRVDPTRGWVRFFTDGNFSGYELLRYVSEVGFGRNSFRAIGHNDQVDGVTWGLPIGTTIMLYDHDPAGGGCLALTSSGSRDLRNGWFHDKLSVFEVRNGDFCADGADRRRPYDRNTYLAAHNSHCSPAHGWALTWNQDLSMEDQLDYGARVLQLDTLEDSNGVQRLVHNDFTFTTLQRGGLPAENLDDGLRRIENWLNRNPREVVTLIFQNDGGDLGPYLLNQSRIRNRIYMHQHGSWPTLNQLIASGKRIVVFEMNTVSSGLMRQYNYCVENDYSSWQNTSARSESGAINEMTRSLFYMNNINATPPNLWPPATTPNDLSDLIALALQFPQLPNYIGVDRIAEGGEGGADMARYCNATQWPLRENNGGRAEFASFGGADCNVRWLSATSRPRIGSTLNYALNTLSSPSLPPLGPGATFIGISDRVWNGFPILPYAITLPGGASCNLRVPPELALSFVASGTSRSLSLPVPNQSELLGLEVFLQTVDLGGGMASLSSLSRARIGAR